MCKNLFVFLVILILMNACGNQENTIEDPIDIHRYAREDTTEGIVVVAGNNPIEVRNRIEEYEIPETTFIEKRKVLYAILDSLTRVVDTNQIDAYNVTDSLNYMAIHYMQNILQDIESVYNPLKHKMLSTAVSSDKQLRAYSWNENIGAPFNSNINVFQYFTKDKKLRTAFNKQGQNTHDIDFKASKITAVYKLNSRIDKNLYLVNFEGDMNGSQKFKGSTVLALQNDTLHFDYIGFSSLEEYCFMLYPKDMNVLSKFDYKKQQLVYTMKNSDGTIETIVYVFNGEQFELKQD